MEITLEAKQILDLIINLQLDSYSRILDEQINDEDTWFLLQFQATKEDIYQLARERINDYTDMKFYPWKLLVFDQTEIMVMRHILFRMEDLWMNFNPKGVTDLWKVFFDLEEQRTPKVRYVTKFIKLYRNGK